MQNRSSRINDVEFIWITRDGRAVTEPPKRWKEIEQSIADGDDTEVFLSTSWMAEGWPILAGDPDVEEGCGVEWEPVDYYLKESIYDLVDKFDNDEDNHRFTDSFDPSECNYFFVTTEGHPNEVVIDEDTDWKHWARRWLPKLMSD